jgi:hypothetical protein
MKNTWVLRVIVLSGFMLLGARVSSIPTFTSVSETHLHATTDHSDFIFAIELEDEVEDAITSFIAATSFDWKLESAIILGLLVLLIFAPITSVPLPAYLRYHNLRL